MVGMPFSEDKPYPVKNVKLGRKDLSDVSPPEVHQMRDLMTALEGGSKRVLVFQQKRFQTP
jgi:hypothetical protein